MIAFFLTAALIGSVPPVSLQAAIKASVGKKLADPFSAQYDWQPIKSEALYCGWVNAKNRFGAYTGYQPFMVLYAISNSGKPLVFSTELDPDIVTSMCLKERYGISR